MTTIPCPHCGALMPNAGALNWHVPCCLSSPAVRALVLDAMTDPTRPGHAVSAKKYNVVARVIDAPCRATLEGKYGSWIAAVEHFGLVPASKRVEAPAPPRSRSAKTEADIDAELARQEREEREATARALAEEERERYALRVCRVRVLANGSVAMVLR